MEPYVYSVLHAASGEPTGFEIISFEAMRLGEIHLHFCDSELDGQLWKCQLVWNLCIADYKLSIYKTPLVDEKRPILTVRWTALWGLMKKSKDEFCICVRA